MGLLGRSRVLLLASQRSYQLVVKEESKHLKFWNRINSISKGQLIDMSTRSNTQPVMEDSDSSTDMSASSSTQPFSGVSDRFRCITVSSEKEDCVAPEFQVRLTSSLDRWKEEGIRGVWFHVHPNHSTAIPILVKQGFVFHHANEERLALYLWLDPKDKCQIPSFAHTLIGVGGMVINDKDEILVVQERFYLAPTWKLPGGYLEPGEEIYEGAVREVFEETGVQTEFRSIVAFRHGHKFNFGCSDIYIIVALKPVSSDIKSCSQEISRCRWMPVKEYATH